MELGNSTQTETPTKILPAKPSPLTNGFLKRHAPLHHPVVVTYKECLKNHAASIGAHALDGCGEFMPSPTSNPAEPTTLKCAACGCHRNFHRREPDEPLPNSTPALEYQPLHRHHPPPPGRGSSPNDSPSPPPISSSYYTSAPQMLLALSNNPISSALSQRKRFRTKFSQDQKDRMLEFAEKVGWKMQKRDEDAINELCSEIGVERGVVKVWMHNNKNLVAKKEAANCDPPLALGTNANSSSNT